VRDIGVIFFTHTRGSGNVNMLRELRIGIESGVTGVVITGWKLFAPDAGDSSLPTTRLN
jgi:hypothetical protein